MTLQTVPVEMNQAIIYPPISLCILLRIFEKYPNHYTFVVFIAFLTVIIKSLSCYRILSIFYDLESEIWLHNTAGIKQNLFLSQMDAIYYLGKKKQWSKGLLFYKH